MILFSFISSAQSVSIADSVINLYQKALRDAKEKDRQLKIATDEIKKWTDYANVLYVKEQRTEKENNELNQALIVKTFLLKEYQDLSDKQGAVIIDLQMQNGELRKNNAEMRDNALLYNRTAIENCTEVGLLDKNGHGYVKDTVGVVGGGWFGGGVEKIYIKTCTYIPKKSNLQQVKVVFRVYTTFPQPHIQDDPVGTNPILTKTFYLMPQSPSEKEAKATLLYYEGSAEISEKQCGCKIKADVLYHYDFQIYQYANEPAKCETIKGKFLYK